MNFNDNTGIIYNFWHLTRLEKQQQQMNVLNDRGSEIRKQKKAEDFEIIF